MLTGAQSCFAPQKHRSQPPLSCLLIQIQSDFTEHSKIALD